MSGGRVARRVTGAVLGTTLAALPALAGADCPLERAVYHDVQTGFRLEIHAPRPWESLGMISAMLRAKTLQGQELWGRIEGNMGTSRDTGSLFHGCAAPGPDDVPPDEATLQDCQMWQGVVYALTAKGAEPLPDPAAPAPQQLLFTDLGRQLRYQLFDAAGQEPWDQLALLECRAAD